ncbi:unnamed protein product [Heterobilharzia americana]|nr:unnamed protein product [Heterobilharzia americana]
MKIPNEEQQQQPAQIIMNGRNLREVACFTYLGSTVSTTGGTGTDEDVKVRIGKARQAFIRLKPVWRSSALSMKRERDLDFQHQCQISAPIWFRDLARYEGDFQQTTDIHQKTAYAGSLLKLRWPE